MTEEQQIIPVVTIGVTGVADLARWVAAGDTLEQRQERAEIAKDAINQALAAVDHDEFNRALRDAAKRITHGDPR